MEVTTVFLLEPEGETPLLKKKKRKKKKKTTAALFCVRFSCHQGDALYRKYVSTHAVVLYRLNSCLTLREDRDLSLVLKDDSEA